MGVYVYHDIKTSELKAPDGSVWIDYWKEHTGLEIPEICPCCGESNNEFVGAHVFKYIEAAQGTNKTKYITPTCASCNDKYKNGKALEHKFSVENEMLLPI